MNRLPIYNQAQVANSPRNWTAYHAAQTNEKDQFQILLHDLCRAINQPPHTKGRRPLPICDVVFSAAFKVYSTVSARRFMSDLRARPAFCLSFIMFPPMRSPE